MNRPREPALCQLYRHTFVHSYQYVFHLLTPLATRPCVSKTYAISDVAIEIGDEAKEWHYMEFWWGGKTGRGQGSPSGRPSDLAVAFLWPYTQPLKHCGYSSILQIIYLGLSPHLLGVVLGMSLKILDFFPQINVFMHYAHTTRFWSFYFCSCSLWDFS